MASVRGPERIGWLDAPSLSREHDAPSDGDTAVTKRIHLVQDVAVHTILLTTSL
jgi:hypothetical protein